jgi:hypothetical protein
VKAINRFPQSLYCNTAAPPSMRTSCFEKVS